MRKLKKEDKFKPVLGLICCQLSTKLSPPPLHKPGFVHIRTVIYILFFFQHLWLCTSYTNKEQAESQVFKAVQREQLVGKSPSLPAPSPAVCPYRWLFCFTCDRRWS